MKSLRGVIEANSSNNSIFLANHTLVNDSICPGQQKIDATLQSYLLQNQYCGCFILGYLHSFLFYLLFDQWT